MPIDFQSNLCIKESQLSEVKAHNRIASGKLINNLSLAFSGNNYIYR